MSAWYLDTSAFVTFVGSENYSNALRNWIAERTRSDDVLVSSDLLRTEGVRAARRSGDAMLLARTMNALDELDLIRLTQDTFTAAGVVDPPVLRSLDAIHIAAAQTLGPDLAGIVAYDARLIDAARALGIPSVSPGLDP